MMNKFGFDTDYAIYCMSLNATARERREAAEAKAKVAAEKAEAVNSVLSMLVSAINYLEADIPYLMPNEIADQFYHSLADVNNVPADIIESAAKDYLNCKEYNDTIECALNLIIDKCNSPIIISIEE